MEENNIREERLPGEVVETYRPRDTREVVETYVRPLPGLSRKSQSSVRSSRRRRTGLRAFLICLCVSVLLAAGAWCLSVYQQSQRQDDPGAEEESPGKGQEITIPTYPYGEGASLSLEREAGRALTTPEIYRRVNPAVVMVVATLDQEAASVGTGVIFSQDGYILTNYHVVEGGRECMVVLSNDLSFPALYVAGDSKNDLAVLKTDLTGLPVAEFGDSDLLQVGDPVYAIGNPLGVELRGTFTNGIVSAVNRDVEVEGRVMNLIQTNTALNTGNSGGPLINEYGQVVGINVVKMMSKYSSVEGLGFSIPTASAERMVNDLLTYGEVQPEPRLGMSVLQVSEQVADGIWGVKVVEVNPGTAAEQAGMQVGDFVVRVGDLPVHSSRDVFRARRKYHLGDQMRITVWRDGKLITLTLDLQEAVQ